MLNLEKNPTLTNAMDKVVDNTYSATAHCDVACVNNWVHMPKVGSPYTDTGLDLTTPLTKGRCLGHIETDGTVIGQGASTGANVPLPRIAADGPQDGTALTDKGHWAIRDITGALRDPGRVSKGPWELNRMPG
jgi:hypothetical protein